MGSARRLRRTKAVLALAPALILVGNPAGAAVDPTFGAPSTNPFGLSTIGSLASPALADIDGDGDLDAFIGDQYGNTIFFRNTRSATAPAFATPSTNPFGLTTVGSTAAPDFADIDGDADLDAFIGDSNGDIRFFRNTGSATAPAFAASVANPFGISRVSPSAAPDFADIDGDGDLDAFVGMWTGDTAFFENTGTATAPAFAARSSVDPYEFWVVESHATPHLADIDGDGDVDALIGDSSGTTTFSRNIGSATTPEFAAPSSNPFGLSDVEGSASPELADIDADRDLDAFIGEYDGDTVFFRNGGFAVSDVTRAEGNSGTTAFQFTITRSGSTSDSESVTATTYAGTAKAKTKKKKNDYVSTSATFTFGPGETTKTFTVTAFGDTRVEEDETFFVMLSAPSGGAVSDRLGVGTIVNDD